MRIIATAIPARDRGEVSVAAWFELAPSDGVTDNDSQVLVAPLLFPSPEYIAFRLKPPAVLKVSDPEAGTALFVTTTLDTTVEVPLQSLVENEL
jgi:hypothetical protein